MKKIGKYLVLLCIALAVMIPTLSVADVGNFESYDSDSSDFDWGSSSYDSDWGSSSYYDSDYSGEGGSGRNRFNSFNNNNCYFCCIKERK